MEPLSSTASPEIQSQQTIELRKRVFNYKLKRCLLGNQIQFAFKFFSARYVTCISAAKKEQVLLPVPRAPSASQELSFN